MAGLLAGAGFARLVKDFATWLRNQSGELPASSTDVVLLDLIGGLADPVGLDQVRARRLDDLARLVSLTELADAPASDVDAGVAKDPAHLRPALRAAARRAGLDLGVISAQARLLLNISEPEDDDFWWPLAVLLDDEKDVPLLPWEAVANVEQTVADLNHAAMTEFTWIADLARRCLEGR